MQVKLLNNEGEVVREANIATTALTAPSVLGHAGKFFQLQACDPNLTSDKPQNFLTYKQCRGEFLSAIELRPGVELHDL